MRILGCFSFALAFIHQSNSLKVNVEGAVSLGKDVIDSLSRFLGGSYLNGRRSFISIPEEPIVTIVRTSVLCHNVSFCQNLSNYVEELVTVLAMSLKTVLSQMQNEKFNSISFKQQLKHYLDVTRSILEHVNNKKPEDNIVYYWIHAIKRICAKFQEMASSLVIEDLKDNLEDVSKMKELNQKLVIATVLVELKYQPKLCEEYHICTKSNPVTKSLNRLLERFETMSDDKVRMFIRHLYETLFDTSFYSYMNEKTAHELQIIFNDLAYSSEVPAKDLLLTVHKIVEARLEAIEKNHDVQMTHDALLVHVILSDLDHIYSVHETDQFKQFFEYFYDWFEVENQVKIGRVIHQVVKDIGTELKTIPDDLSAKLINEVKTFLEITIEPEN